MPQSSKAAASKAAGASTRMFWRVALGLAVVAVVGLFLVASHLHSQQTALSGSGALHGSSGPGRPGLGAAAGRAARGGARRPPGGGRRRKETPVHVCFCTDDTDLRALVVAIKTTMAWAADPERFVFHVVTAAEMATLFDTLLHLHIKGAKIEVHSDLEVQAKISAMVPFRTTPTMRQALASPFNFAPFYMHEFFAGSDGVLKIERVLYLDTDVVVQGDLAEAYDVELRAHPVAAVKDCLNRYEDIFNLPELQKLGFGREAVDPRACSVQRGVVLWDLVRWREHSFTFELERWMLRYRDAEDILWHDGFAQPPWLLTLNGSYQELDPAFNCFNLGRPTMNFEEAAVVRRLGFDHKALIYDLWIAISRKYGTMKPYLSTCTEEAKVLHFSGELKPWLSDVWTVRTPAPVCFVPQDLKIPNQTTTDFWTTLVDRPQRLVRCMELWFMHLRPEEDCALKDLEKEWIEDEQFWHDEWKKELKKKKEAAERKKAEEDERKKKEEEKAKEGKGAEQPAAAEKAAEGEDKKELDGSGEDDGEDDDEAAAGPGGGDPFDSLGGGGGGGGGLVGGA